MNLQYTPWTVLLILSAVTSFVLFLDSLRRIRDNGRDALTIAFAVNMLFAGFWAVAHLLQLSSTTVGAKLFWLKVLHLSPGIIPTALLVLTLAYTDRHEWITPRVLALLSIEPVLTLALVWSNPVDGGLMWTEMHVSQVDWGLLSGQSTGSWYYLDRTFGLWYYVNVAYAYAILTTAYVLLFQTVIGSRNVYRGQLIAFVLGSLVPTGAHVAYMLDLVPGPRVNLTSVAFVTWGVFYGFAIFRYRFLDLVPMARDTVIESMPDGYVVLDTDDRIVDTNPAADRIIGGGTTGVGERPADVLPEAAGLFETGESEGNRQDEIVRRIDGEQRYFDAHVSPLYDDDTFVGQLLILRDVTDRRGVEQRYQALIENAFDVITILDPEGRVQYQSPSAERIFGYTPEEMVGTDALEYVHEDDHEQLRSTFDAALSEQGYTQRVEYRIQRKDGETRVLESVGQNLVEHPYVEGIIINSRDVTERKRRENELRRTNERLDEFASVVSHDLRNPLNVAEGHLELAMETDDDRGSLEQIGNSLERMRHIIDDALTLARQGESVGEPTVVEVEELVRAAWANVQTREATLVLNADVTVEADETRLLNAFENLFRNAIEHGGDDVTVRVGLTDDGIFVADDGPGINPGTRDQVFESGVTTEQDGTGFGLAIVNRIVQAHGWSIAVTDSADGGARFEISIETTAWDGQTDSRDSVRTRSAELGEHGTGQVE